MTDLKRNAHSVDGAAMAPGYYAGEEMMEREAGSLQMGLTGGGVDSAKLAQLADASTTNTVTSTTDGSFSVADWLNPAAHAQEKAEERYLIRTGSLTLEIDNYDDSAAEVEKLADRLGGFISDTQMDRYGDGTRTGHITLRIPNDKFFEAFEGLKQLGEVANEQTSSEDVSGEYVSNISRMENLMREQEVLQGMLDDARDVLRSRGLGEAYDILLKTEERLSEVTGQLQQVEDRVKHLADRISLSTLTVNLSERPVYQPDEWSWGYSETFEGSKKDLAIAWRSFVQGTIRFFVVGWLGWLPVIIILVIARWQWRKHITPRLKAAGDARQAKRNSEE